MLKQYTRVTLALSFIAILAYLFLSTSTTIASKSTSQSKSATIKIRGMTCGGCVANVRKELLKLNGILSAKITYKPQQAVIRYNPKETGPKHFIHAIKRAGYDVLTQTTGNKKSKPSKKLALLPAAMPHLKQAFNRDKKYVRLLFMFSPV